MTLDEANAEAIRRIRAAKDCGQWRLDFGELPIERIPDEIGELSEQLTVLALGVTNFSGGDGAIWVEEGLAPSPLGWIR